MSPSPNLKTALRAHLKEGERLLAFCHLPGYDDSELVQKTLPLASRIVLRPDSQGPLPGEENEWEQERERILRQRVKAYFVSDYVALLEEGSTIPPESTSTEKRWVSVPGWVENPPIMERDDIDTEALLKHRVCAYWDSISQDRAEFRESLELVLRRTSSARDELLDFIDSTRKERAGLIRQTELEDKIVYCPLSAKGLFGHVLKLLLNESNGLGAALRKCRLQGCEDFFLSYPSPKGGPIPAYCVLPKHRLDAAKLTKRERDARYRKKKKQERSKKQSTGKGKTRN